MKFGIFLVLFGFCLSLTIARPSESDNESEGNSLIEGSDGEEFDDEDMLSGSEFGHSNADDDDDGWFEDINHNSNENKNGNEGLDADKVQTLEKLEETKPKDTSRASIQATDRLMKELRAIYRSELYKNGAYEIELVDDSNVYEWLVHLRDAIDSDSQLYKSLQEFKRTNGQDSIILNFKFKESFPFSPPFVRVVSPVIYGGHVQAGGAVCNELLTSDGWSSVYSIEAVIMQIASTLTELNGRIPTQNKMKAQEEYNAIIAEDSFKSLAEAHKGNWGEKPSN